MDQCQNQPQDKDNSEQAVQTPCQQLNHNQPSTPEKSKQKDGLSTTEKSENKFLSLTIDAPPLKLHTKYNGCNCQKSRCLKMYCVCFSSGNMCNESCLCDSCLNKTDNMRRSDVINEIITKDPFAFSRADSNRIQYSGDGCNCKKSNCVKKYCECFKNGRQCGKTCRCVNCSNHSINSMKESKAVPKKLKKEHKYV